ncbi:hypothetical protein L596_001657 [Steinernema carpocapsae]|uniref:Uncharacterized protein n=1 Tax=Steinernema carpocapsae TaxID=34508 RepID=A0A4U8ULV5_STECR|nr:hypothetical protein L596_001657 [Steinernema carpocapsae]
MNAYGCLFDGLAPKCSTSGIEVDIVKGSSRKAVAPGGSGNQAHFITGEGKPSLRDGVSPKRSAEKRPDIKDRFVKHKEKAKIRGNMATMRYRICQFQEGARCGQRLPTVKAPDERPWQPRRGGHNAWFLLLRSGVHVQTVESKAETENLGHKQHDHRT